MYPGAAVGKRERAKRICADRVALNDRAGCRAARDDDTVPAVAADDVVENARAYGAFDANTVPCIAQHGRPGGVSADIVPLYDVIGRR